MYKKLGAIVATAALLVLAGAGCSSSENQQTPATDNKPVTDTSPIKIGWMGPLTGDVATVGVVAKQAVELAVKQVNDAGGINGRLLEVTYEDTSCDAKAGNNAGNKLINVDKVPVIVGELCSGPLLAVAPLAEQNKVVVVGAGTTAPAISEAGDYIFRVVPSDSYQGKFAAQFAYNTLNKRKVAVLYAKSDFTEGLATVFTDEFKRSGGEIVLSDNFLQTSRDLRTQLTKIKNSGADLIYFPTYTESGVAGLKQAKDLGIKTQILGVDVFDDPKLQAANGAEGALYTMPMSPTTEEFKTKFLATTGLKELPVYVTQSYDALNVVATALKQISGNITGEEIKNELYKIKNYKGVSGDIGFDEKGDLVGAKYEVKIIKNGKGEIYQAQSVQQK